LRHKILLKKIYSDGTIIELQKFKNGRPLYYITNNFISAKTISTEKVWNETFSGYSLSGEGITFGIWDGGAVRTTHQEFNGRVVQLDEADSLSNHTTHVAGTMVSSGVETDAKGMAFQAQLHAYDWNNDEAEMGFAGASGLLVSNHSYSTITGWHKKEDSLWTWFGDSSISLDEDYNFGFYSHQAALWDTIAWYAPNYLIVKSAGNDRGSGPEVQPVEHWEFVDTNKVVVADYRSLDGGTNGFDCLTNKSTAKNILTVGAVGDLPNGYQKSTDVSMATLPNWGSSWGPTDDGRIKPDLMANGTHLYSSTASADNSYDYFSGTSMAAPSISGSIGLLLEYYKILSDSSTLRSSTIKAILIQTADESGFDPGPDYMFGWGLMNTYKAVRLLSTNDIKPNIYSIKEVPINTGESYEFNYFCPNEIELRVTICWTDPPGKPPQKSLDPTDSMLVNDLDLRAISPQNETHYPWILDPEQPDEPATKGDNYRDNVEQIIIKSPEVGIYTIKITPKNNIQLEPQIVSIVVSTERDKIQLNAPKNESENITTNPILNWQNIEKATSYNLQISTTENFSSTIVDSSNIPTNIFSVNSLLSNTTYFWRVNYTDSLGVSEWSDIWNFKTSLLLPESVTLIYPQKNQYVLTDSIKFIWRKSQPDATEYLFSLSIDSTMSNPVDSTISDTTLVLINLASNTEYWWQVKAKNPTGWGPLSEKRKFTTAMTDVIDNITIPTKFKLYQNHPNPFNPTTTIRFDIAKKSNVSLKIFNALGKLENTILDKQLEAGKYSILFDGRNLPSGIYFYQIQTEQFIQIQKSLLLK